jgi:U4/U6.U5 tri-snRNP-associated protein 1
MSSRKDVIAAAEALNARDRSVVVGSNSLGSGGEIKPAIVYEDLKKMVNVSESSGETSCSVEDTNKLRAILGLKPLRTTGNASAAGGGDGSSEGSGMLSGAAAEAVAVANFKAKEAEEARARELKEIQVRLERAKKKRMLKEKLAGPTLGDSDSGADNGGGASSGSSAADWVKKSRVAALAREAAAAEAKLLAAKREAELEQQDDSSGYSSAHLAGLKVGHGASELLAGNRTSV